MSEEWPEGVTPEVVKDMTLKLRLWLSDQYMPQTQRKEAQRYLAKLWPPHEAAYQAWLALPLSDPRRQLHD